MGGEGHKLRGDYGEERGINYESIKKVWHNLKLSKFVLLLLTDKAKKEGAWHNAP